CLLEVKRNGLALRHVVDQTNEICLEAVTQHACALEFVKESYQTIELCKLAIDKDIAAFKFVINKTFEICSYVVLANENGIAFCDHCLEYKYYMELCLLTVKKWTRGLLFVHMHNLLEDDIITVSLT